LPGLGGLTADISKKIGRAVIRGRISRRPICLGMHHYSVFKDQHPALGVTVIIIAPLFRCQVRCRLQRPLSPQPSFSPPKSETSRRLP